jgi:hypothetical protein
MSMVWPTQACSRYSRANAADGGRGHVADALRPTRANRAHVRDQACRRRCSPASRPSASTSSSAPISTASTCAVPSSARGCRGCRAARRGRWSRPTPAACAWRGRAGSSRWGPPGRARRCVARRNGRSSARAAPRAASRGSARTGRRVGLGLDRHPLCRAAPVTDRCGSTCTRFMPRTRASAWRQMPTTPPEASMLEPQEMR